VELKNNLTDKILYHYNNFLKANPGLADTKDPHAINNHFFKWQTKSRQRKRASGSPSEPDCTRLGWMFLRDSPEFSLIEDAFQQLADSMLIFLRRSKLAISRNRTVSEAWASVHHGGDQHGIHTHPGSMLSGVYYVQVPTDAGHLQFMDLRGGVGLKPFDAAVPIAPTEGELVLFPSWVPHEILPTKGHGKRISIALNIGGGAFANHKLSNLQTALNIPLVTS